MLRRVVTVSLLALVLAAPAAAGDVTVTLGLEVGKLALRAPRAAATTDHAVRVPVTVADARGSGAGWTLRLVSAPQVRVTSITARCAGGSTCTLPRLAAATSGGAILHAARDSGMGVIQLIVTVAALPGGSADAPLTFSVS